MTVTAAIRNTATVTIATKASLSYYEEKKFDIFLLSDNGWLY
jgi:hypothetical protein